MDTEKYINFLLFNPRSLNNKVYSFMDSLIENSVDVAGICETWLFDKTNPITAVIKDYGYLILHDPGPDRIGGGTAIVYKASFSFAEVKLPNITFKSFEYTAAAIKSKTCLNKILLVIIYRTGNLSSIFIQEIDKLMSHISEKYDCFILAGDLNIHFNLRYSNKLIDQVANMFDSYGLKGHVNEPTHINGGCLDVVYTYSMMNKLTCSTNIDSLNNLGSDHFRVYCKLNIQSAQKYYKTIQYRNLHDLEKDKFSGKLEVIVKKQLNSDKHSFSDSINQLTNSAVALLDEHAPFLEKKIAVVDKAPWFDSEYRTQRKLRRKAEKRWKKAVAVGSPEIDELHEFYKQLCLQSTTLAMCKKKQHFCKTIEKSNGNPRTLFSLINKELDKNQSKKLPDTSDVADLASRFNNFFHSKIDKIRTEMKHTSDPVSPTANLEFLSDFEPVTFEELSDIISNSGIKCSPADILPQSLYQENISTLLPLLVNLVNTSLLTGNFDGVKLADIIPLLKDESSDPNVLKNYRPVSNLTFIGKLIERVVLKRLEDHLSRNNLNCSEQFAYKKNHSTETLLIKMTDDLLVAFDEGSATVVMLLDLSAAFDTVDHSLLLKILESEIGLKGNS